MTFRLVLDAEMKEAAQTVVTLKTKGAEVAWLAVINKDDKEKRVKKHWEEGGPEQRGSGSSDFSATHGG